jgi:hypothetical protein
LLWTDEVSTLLPLSRFDVAWAVEAIVLDDAPMVFDDTALLVEDEAAISSLPDVLTGEEPPEDDVTEVGDEVLFDA